MFHCFFGPLLVLLCVRVQLYEIMMMIVVPYELYKLYELYDWGKVPELYGTFDVFFSERTSYVGLQAQNSITAIVSCCCPLLHSTGSSNSITGEFTCEVYYLALLGTVHFL